LRSFGEKRDEAEKLALEERDDKDDELNVKEGLSNYFV